MPRHLAESYLHMRRPERQPLVALLRRRLASLGQGSTDTAAARTRTAHAAGGAGSAWALRRRVELGRLDGVADDIAPSKMRMYRQCRSHRHAVEFARAGSLPVTDMFRPQTVTCPVCAALRCFNTFLLEPFCYAYCHCYNRTGRDGRVGVWTGFRRGHSRPR